MIGTTPSRSMAKKRDPHLFVRDKRWSQIGFFLSKFGPGKYPPEELGKKWKDAINSFYTTLGEGRTEKSFYGSLKNIRDEFDYWDNNVERVGHKAELRPINQEVKDEWENESREKIWSVVKGIRNVVSEIDPVDRMHFPLAAEELQDQLNKERFEEGKEDEQENDEDLDQRGWVYVLWCPAYPTWVVTGKAKNFRDRINGYQTYSPNRDYELVGLAYVENRKEGEEKLQDEIDNEHAGKRGKASNKPSEWFEITKEQAYETLERLNPETTFKNHPEQD